MNNLVIQIRIDENLKFSSNAKLEKQIYDLSNHTVEQYAKRCKADYFIHDHFDQKIFKLNKNIFFQKLKVYDFEEKYDNVLYVDSDIIIKEDAPNLFHLCKNKFSVALEIHESVGKLAEKTGIPKENYFNAGLMYMPKNFLIDTREKIKEYAQQREKWPAGDQGAFNKMVYDMGLPVNYLNNDEWNPCYKIFGKYVDHYTGTLGKKEFKI